MESRLLFKLSLTTALISLILIFIISENLEPRVSNINQLNERSLDSYVKIVGKVKDFRETKGLYIITIEDPTGKVDVIIYKTKSNKVEAEKLKKAQRLEVLGKVSEYKGSIQINAIEIKDVS